MNTKELQELLLKYRYSKEAMYEAIVEKVAPTKVHWHSRGEDLVTWIEENIYMKVNLEMSKSLVYKQSVWRAESLDINNIDDFEITHMECILCVREIRPYWPINEPELYIQNENRLMDGNGKWEDVITIQQIVDHAYEHITANEGASQ